MITFIMRLNFDENMERDITNSHEWHRFASGYLK